MFSTGAPRRDARFLLRLVSQPILILSLLCISGLVPAFAQTTIINSDFEDGTTQGWGVCGGGVVANSTDVAHGGTHSLLITGRTAGFNGPSINVLGSVTKGATYQVTAWVRLAAGTPATQLKITGFRNLASGSNFDGIASSSTTGVTDTAW